MVHGRELERSNRALRSGDVVQASVYFMLDEFIHQNSPQNKPHWIAGSDL